MLHKAPSDREHDVWPPPPELEPAEEDAKPIGLPKFLSRLSVFTAALSIGCFVFDVVISEICKVDNYDFLRRFLDGYLLASCYIQLLLAAVSVACGVRSRTVTVSQADKVIRIGAIFLTFVCVVLILTILTRPQEK